MEAVQIKKALATVKFHAKIAWRGFCRTLYGAAVSGLIVFSIYGFASVSGEGGWAAVSDFVASCATLVVALGNMYLIGCNKAGVKYG